MRLVIAAIVGSALGGATFALGAVAAAVGRGEVEKVSGIQESMPALIDIHYKCHMCGMSAKMNQFYGGPAYAHHWHYAIKCSNPICMNHSVGMLDWKDSPEDAIRAWNRRTQ